MKHLIAPSILAADFGKIYDEVRTVNESVADWLHIDVMDGHFVPNISFGFPVIRAIQRKSEKPLDVHLMIENPDKYIAMFRDHGAGNITVHLEACPHLHRTIQMIKNSGARAGVALNPHTPVHSLVDILDEVDMVLIMSVNPGFGGQKFIPHTYHKIRELKKMIYDRNLSTMIEIDGGVVPGNAQKLLDVGVDIFVAGSAIFKSENPLSTIEQMKNLRPQSKFA